MAFDVEVPAIEIEEQTGARRSVLLRGRALPYQGVAWGGEQRTKTTWYQGNPVATIQLLGPTLDPTEMHGTWKWRFLQNQVDLQGFPGIDAQNVTPTDMVAVFDSIRDAGNDLRVTWGPNTRYGVLTKFKPSWIRLQDVEWEMEFTWVGSEPIAPRAGGITEQLPPLQSAQRNFDGQWVQSPLETFREYLFTAQTKVNSVRSNMGRLFDAVRVATAAVTLPAQIAAQANAATVSIAREAQSLTEQMGDIPYTYAQSSDRVVSVLEMQGYRYGMDARSREIEANARRQAKQFLDIVFPEAIAIIIVPQDTSLRAIAVTYYGSADSWQVIADQNNIAGSIAAEGTVLIIPSLAERTTT